MSFPYTKGQAKLTFQRPAHLAETEASSRGTGSFFGSRAGGPSAFQEDVLFGRRVCNQAPLRHGIHECVAPDFSGS